MQDNKNQSKRIMSVGFYDNGTGRHQSNTVYHSRFVTPAITTITVWYATDKGAETLEKKIIRVGQSSSPGSQGGGGLFPKRIDANNLLRTTRMGYGIRFEEV
jgi:hypothetical protein